MSVLHFLLLNNIPLYGYSTFVGVLVDGYLGCFSILTLTESAVANAPCKSLLCAVFPFSQVYFLGVELLILYV